MKKLVFILGVVGLFAIGCKETDESKKIHTTTATVVKVTRDSVYFDNGWKAENNGYAEVGEELEIEYIKVKKDK